jgi:hypothetical protein
MIVLLFSEIKKLERLFSQANSSDSGIGRLERKHLTTVGLRTILLKSWYMLNSCLLVTLLPPPVICITLGEEQHF